MTLSTSSLNDNGVYWLVPLGTLDKDYGFINSSMYKVVGAYGDK
jgi:hypothetical protein